MFQKTSRDVHEKLKSFLKKLKTFFQTEKQVF